ncbi:MAG: lysophospholipid acyltransferase family protein [Clostridia bacterium]
MSDKLKKEQENNLEVDKALIFEPKKIEAVFVEQKSAQNEPKIEKNYNKIAENKEEKSSEPKAQNEPLAQKNELVVQKGQKTKKVKVKKTFFLYRLVAKIGLFVVKFFWPTHIYFKERAITDSRALYICNHYGYVDSNPIIGRIFGKKTNVVFKSELAENKLFAGCMKEVGGIPVKRGESDMSAIKQILKVLNNDEQLLIYPEGARNPHDIKEMLPFKDGTATFALKTHCPIVPMMQYRKSQCYRKNYLMVGEPFDLSQFYDEKLHVVKQAATEYIYAKMLELRKEIDILVEVCHGSKKKYLKYKEEHKK